VTDDAHRNMVSVEIEYCVPCGHRERASALQTALLEEFGPEIDRVALVTGDGGVFEVRADGDLVLDTDEEGYDEAAVIERVGDRLA
jgi:selenoprotein W-related protein